MSSSDTNYTEQQKADRSAVTSGLLEQKTAQTLQDAGDSSLRKRAENKATLAVGFGGLANFSFRMLAGACELDLFACG
jgi:hypothetical protein